LPQSAQTASNILALAALAVRRRAHVFVTEGRPDRLTEAVEGPGVRPLDVAG